MKVLSWLNYSPEKVGIGKYSGELTRSLVSQGHQIRVLQRRLISPPGV